MSSYEILYQNGKTECAPSLTAARTAIAAHFGRDRSEVGLADHSSSCGTVEQYAVWLAGGGGDHVATITADDPGEPRDPLLGVSPDEIVVGPGGQTLAQAAEDETSDLIARAAAVLRTAQHAEHIEQARALLAQSRSLDAMWDVYSASGHVPEVWQLAALAWYFRASQR